MDGYPLPLNPNSDSVHWIFSPRFRAVTFMLPVF